MIKLGKAHGLCSRRGRDYLFSETDLLALWEVLREPAKTSKPPIVNAFPSDAQKYERLIRLTAKKKGAART
ncbi:hypothetical protein [Rhizobium leguminosarum]|uniref:hypothetical protein n=1 Tax=Rhizobium leguminosarum TaxID=384 RepID=UPI003D7C2974